MQWLVGWFRDKGTKGICIGKKVHCGPMTGAMMSANYLALHYQKCCGKEPSLLEINGNTVNQTNQFT